jgi:hypothetical protein
MEASALLAIGSREPVDIKTVGEPWIECARRLDLTAFHEAQQHGLRTTEAVWRFESNRLGACLRRALTASWSDSFAPGLHQRER